MDVIELRVDLHNMIDKISDSNLLNAVKTILAKDNIRQTDWWDTISEDERAEIDQGLAEDERGDTKPHDEIMAKYKFISRTNQQVDNSYL